MKADIQFLSKNLIKGHGTTELRCVQPAEYLTRGGVSTDYGCLYRTLPCAEKAIVFSRVTCDFQTLQYLKYANEAGLVTIYDVDDLLFENVEGGPQQLSTAHLGYKKAMQFCGVSLVSTQYLKSRAERFLKDVRVVKNGLSRDFEIQAKVIRDRRKAKSQSDCVTFAYLSGSKYHDKDFSLIQEDLLQILKNHQKFRLILVGKLNFSPEFNDFGERFTFIPFVKYKDFHYVFENIDVNLVPLQIDDAFSQARSEIKYVEAGIFGIPTIASATETYKQAITQKYNGIVIPNSDWRAAIKTLLQDRSAREQIGENAFRDVVTHYSCEAKEKEWAKLIKDIMKDHRGTLSKGKMSVKLYYTMAMCSWGVRQLRIQKRKSFGEMIER